MSRASTDPLDLEPEPSVEEQRPVHVFLGRTEVAHYLGMRSIRSLAKVTLPSHDAEIGDRKGWLPSTIDAWKEQRPGRGRHGQRTGHTRTGEVVPSRPKAV